MEQEIRRKLDEQQYGEAFELLVERYQNKVYRLAWSMLGSEAAAEDAAQEAFIRIWKALPGFRGQASLSTWIYAIARNVCLTTLRAAALRKTISIDEPNVLRAVERRRDSSASRSAEPDLDRLLLELPEKQR